MTTYFHLLSGCYYVLAFSKSSKVIKDFAITGGVMLLASIAIAVFATIAFFSILYLRSKLSKEN